MNTIPALPPEQGGIGSRTAPSAEAIRNQLAKILASRVLRSADGQSKLLRYTVERTIEGRHCEIKQYSLAIDVFGRAETFDPKHDSIVREEARKLRASLKKYYDGEGEQDLLRIDVPKGGYVPVFRLAATDAPAGDLDRSAVEQPALLSRMTQPGGVRWFLGRRPWTAGAVATVVLVLAGVTGYWARSAGNTVAAGSSRSIAVLPFHNLSGGKNDEVFADGLTEDLIDSLVRVPGLHVVARTSAFQFKGKTVDVRKIGRDLDVRTILEGGVQTSGNRIRITARLDDAANGYHLWSERYDREGTDILAVQQEISRAITETLGVKLAFGGAAAGVAYAAAAQNPEAYENYLKGRYFWNKSTREGFESAIGYFQQAVAKDSSYAPAYVGLANSYAWMPTFSPMSLRESAPKAKAAALKALELDSALGEAHVALANVYFDEHDWSAAEREFRTGLALNPGDAGAHSSFGSYLTRMDRPQEALAEFQTALSLDPVSTFAMQAVGRTLTNMHRFDDAIQQFQRALALEPNFGVARQALGMAYLLDGKYTEGIAETEKARQIMGGDSMTTSQLGYAYAVSGNRAAALQILSQSLDLNRRGAFPAYAIANIYIGLGDKDRAIEWLRTAIEKTEASLALKSNPIYDPLRTDSGFTELLRRMKLNQ